MKAEDAKTGTELMKAVREGRISNTYHDFIWRLKHLELKNCRVNANTRNHGCVEKHLADTTFEEAWYQVNRISLPRGEQFRRVFFDGGVIVYVNDPRYNYPSVYFEPKEK